MRNKHARHGLGISTTPEYLMLKRAKCRAKFRNLPINIELEDIVIPTHCPLLGVTLGEGGLRYYSPSLDCFEPSKGYVKGNVWVISNKANSIKRELNLEQWKLFVSALEEKWKQQKQ